jgi:hypothetical protein
MRKGDFATHMLLRQSRKAARTAPAVVLASLVAVGCGGGGDSKEKPPSKPRPAATTTTASAPPPVDTRPPEAPSPGTELATSDDYGGPVATIGNTKGRGFSFVYGGADADDDSSVVSYDVAGTELEDTVTNLTGACGAADVMVPGRGRLILTELVSVEEAEGIEAATNTLELSASDPTSGGKVWTATLIRPREDEIACTQGGRPTLENFTATADGRFGVYKEEDRASWVIDLENGELRRDRKALAAYGDYVAADPDGGGIDDNGPYDLTDPESGRKVGRIEGAGLIEPPPFPGGVYESEAGGLSSDGQQLLTGGSIGGHDQAQAFSLPHGRPTWHGGSGSQVVASGGGVVVVRDGDYKLIGVDDRTGKRLWKLPDSEVCTISESQMLLSVKEQLATIDLKSGEQVEFDENSSDCPRNPLPGGIAYTGPIDSSARSTVTQIIEP